MSDFAKWLRLGLGRANLYLQAHGDAGVRKDLVYACTHNLAFDRQIEWRIDYLIELIGLTAEPRYYRDRIIVELAACDSGRPSADLEQLVVLCRIFAEQGNPRARLAMYQALERGALDDRGDDSMVMGSEFIALDGIAGFKAIGHLAQEDWILDSWARTLEEREGVDAAWASLPEDVRARVSGERAPREKPTPRPEMDIEAATQTVLSSSDEDRILPSLSLFVKKKFPGPPERLMELARSGNHGIAWKAMRALRHVDGYVVRRFALDAISDAGLRAAAVGVLATHYEAGDFELYRKLFEEVNDSFVQHHVAQALIDAAELHLAQEAVPILLQVYEGNPCSVCRRHLVKLLIAMNALPAAVREELRFDADLDNRKLVPE